ncbi:MAG: hypothetical protein AAFR03_16505, partial [Pseudomonadota bacterium]
MPIAIITIALLTLRRGKGWVAVGSGPEQGLHVSGDGDRSHLELCPDWSRFVGWISGDFIMTFGQLRQHIIAGLMATVLLTGEALGP